MQTITVSRTVAGDAAAVRAAMADLEAFMAAGGFASVSVDGDELRIGQPLGLGRIELVLDVVERPGAALAYVQREGIFEAMETRYELSPVDGGTRVAATTDYTLGGVVGTVLDGTVIARRRRQELTAQFDWLADQVAGG